MSSSDRHRIRRADFRFSGKREAKTAERSRRCKAKTEKVSFFLLFKEGCYHMLEATLVLCNAIEPTLGFMLKKLAVQNKQIRRGVFAAYRA